MSSKARHLGNTGCIAANLELPLLRVLRGSVRLENGVNGAGICPGLSITIQIIHPSSFLKTEKLLQHKAFFESKDGEIQKNGHAFEKSKNVT